MSEVVITRVFDTSGVACAHRAYLVLFLAEPAVPSLPVILTQAKRSGRISAAYGDRTSLQHSREARGMRLIRMLKVTSGMQAHPRSFSIAFRSLQDDKRSACSLLQVDRE